MSFAAFSILTVLLDMSLLYLLLYKMYGEFEDFEAYRFKSFLLNGITLIIYYNIPGGPVFKTIIFFILQIFGFMVFYKLSLKQSLRGVGVFMGYKLIFYFLLGLHKLPV